MKLPLTRSAFPDVALSPTQVNELTSTVDSLLDETLEAASLTLDVDSPRVNEHVWKRVKTFSDSVTLYHDRSNHQSSSVYSSTPSFLAVGRLACGLEDAMFGTSSATVESQRIRSSYTSDGIVDCQILHEIHSPSPKSPFHHLNVQWLAMASGALAFFQPRDYVVVDSAGILSLPLSTSRIGYSIRQSVVLDHASPLTHWKLVRGSMSVCTVFQEVSSSCVQVYIKMQFDPRASGHLGRRLASTMALHHTQSVMQALECAQLKKLSIAVIASERQDHKHSLTEDELGSSFGSSKSNNNTSPHHQHQSRRTTLRDECGACDKTVGTLRTNVVDDADATCSLCRRLLCRSCRIRKELSFAGRYNRIIKTKVVVCSVCVSHAIHSNTQKVLVDSLVGTTTTAGLRPTTVLRL